jgi:hypothetical protein
MHRWDNNIKMYFKQIELEVLNWVYLARDRNECRTIVNTVIYCHVLGVV